ncbi:MAG: hypothetical protein J1F10_01175 [Muribaculaceae bacterium]|nr:hypothetical protein [Muribaculaceae bacterium]
MNKNIILLLLVPLFLNAEIRINPEVESVFTQSPLIISKKIESDSGFNNLLNRYLHLCLIGEDINGLNQDSLLLLFKRPSFTNLSFKLLSSKDFLKQINVFYPKEQFERLDEYSVNILYKCFDSNTVYSITDSLLKVDNDKGLVALWEKCNIHKLKNYDLYKQRVINSKRVYDLIMLVIINHNSKNYGERDILMGYLRKIDKQIFKQLKDLFHEEDFIDYPTYLFELIL